MTATSSRATGRTGDPPATFRDAGHEELRLGRDFDEVVLGIPVGAHARICAPLLAQSEHWRQMVERVKTVRTQALQTWAECTAAGLGWALPGQDIASVLWEYDRESLLNVWGDLTEVAKWEGWPEGQGPGNIAYFCGPMRDDPPPAAGAAPRARPTATSERDKVRQAVLNFAVERRRHHVEERVPAGRRPARVSMGAADRSPPGRAAAAGEARVDAQYFRANVSDSERFVLTVPGSSQYRLPANDPNEFSNLYLAGDWTRVHHQRGLHGGGDDLGDALQRGDLRLSAALSDLGRGFLISGSLLRLRERARERADLARGEARLPAGPPHPNP